MATRAVLARSALVLVFASAIAVSEPLIVAAPAAAVVYCKTVGVPKGCVVRPPAAVIYCTAPGVPFGCVVRPAVRTAVYCTRPGFPVGCVARPAVGVPGVGAPGVGVAPGVGAPGVGVAPANRGGPVNRRGVR